MSLGWLGKCGGMINQCYAKFDHGKDEQSLNEKHRLSRLVGDFTFHLHHQV